MTTTTTTQLLKAKRPIIFSGPSGAGKSTLIHRLFAEHPHTFSFSVSHTTRAPRGAEKNGVEYHFVPRAEFEGLIADGGFIEHAQYGSNFYGTSVAEIERIREEGMVPVLDIEMEGVKQVARHAELGSEARFLFVGPPNMEVLERRLRGRGMDSEEAVGKRLEQARREVAFADSDEGRGVFGKRVVNDDLERTYEEVRAWVLEG